MPRFDKAVDDRLPAEQWPACQGLLDLVLLEGWCVGARPQAAAALIEPINELERREDPRGIWRTYVNDQLDGPYRRLYSYLDRLILLAAPDFSVVHHWRKQQENALRERIAMSGGRADAVMDDAALDCFMSHYERITRHILDYMPGQADLVVQLNEDRAKRS